MDTCVKNGKPRTKHICTLKLIFPLLVFFFFASLSPVICEEKTWIIVIDAGHGDKDPGAIGLTTKEKNINLAIALKTGEYLEQNVKNVKVLYTRKSDVFVGLKERAEFANRHKADLFISIHANWAGTSKIRGAETFVMGLSKDEQNLEVAMKENEVILLEDDFSSKYQGFDPKSPESYIIFSLMQNVFKEQSLDLATKIQNQFSNHTGRIDRGVKQDGFWVLVMTSMPSVLIETGFITNPEEEKYLASKSGQDYIASAIFRASRDYINEVDKKSYVSTGIDNAPDTEAGTSVESPVSLSGNLSFMVQIVTSAEKKAINPENFKGITEVTELSAGDIFKYATGNFRSYPDAAEYRKKIELIYPDAFVIAVKDNKILPLQEALGSKPEK
ncbi:MAG: N-acetylmuramoyl-L-alanine amidase [Bacteroidales bacterium]